MEMGVNMRIIFTASGLRNTQRMFRAAGIPHKKRRNWPKRERKTDPKQPLVKMHGSFFLAITSITYVGQAQAREFELVSNFISTSLNANSLIAIMLGRFRMTVRDCMDEYKKMGDEIFGNPRPIYRRRALVVPWTKYKSSAMENAVMDVTARRCEVLEGFNPVTLDSIPGLCKT